MKNILLAFLVMTSTFSKAQFEFMDYEHYIDTDLMIKQGKTTIEKFVTFKGNTVQKEKISELQFNIKGDTIYYSYTNENELTWKDEVTFIYENNHLIKKQVISHSQPILAKKNIYNILPSDNVSFDTSFYFFNYKDNRLSSREWGASKANITNSIAFSYQSENMIKHLDFYSSYDPDYVPRTSYYNDQNQRLDSILRIIDNDTLVFRYKYDLSNKLIYGDSKFHQLTFTHLDQIIKCEARFADIHSSIYYYFNHRNRLIKCAYKENNPNDVTDDLFYNDNGLLEKITSTNNQTSELIKTYTYKYH